MKIQIGDEVRDMTAAELAQVATDAAEAQARADTKAARIAAREALLTKLGITADEAQLLLGGM
jgi:hypothetical protein